MFGAKLNWNGIIRFHVSFFWTSILLVRPSMSNRRRSYIDLIHTVVKFRNEIPVNNCSLLLGVCRESRGCRYVLQLFQFTKSEKFTGVFVHNLLMKQMHQDHFIMSVGELSQRPVPTSVSAVPKGPPLLLIGARLYDIASWLSGRDVRSICRPDAVLQCCAVCWCNVPTLQCSGVRWCNVPTQQCSYVCWCNVPTLQCSAVCWCNVPTQQCSYVYYKMMQCANATVQ